MTDKLALKLSQQLDDISRRLSRLEANQTILIGWAREVALVRGADHVVEEIDAHLQGNGDAR